MIEMTKDIKIILSREKLNSSEALDYVTLPTTGGTSCFIGTTRNNFKGKQVITLFYEAYEKMAEKEIEKVCLEAKKKFNVIRICILHRLGEVSVTEASVVIACSSEHRHNAIKATEYLIDELKARVPIWKKEIYFEGDSLWKENKEVFWKKNSPS